MAAPRFSPFRRYRAALARLRRDRRGSVLPLIAVSFFVLVGSAGFAVDGARLMLMHAKLQASIDAASLSAVARLSTTDYQGQVSKFARANFLDGYIGAEIASITSVASSNRETLTVTATASAPTSFMQLFNIKLMSTSASTTVTRAMGGLEVALILDVTGSMETNDKIGSLKTAAKALINILFGSSATVDKLYVGIVPFSQTVNIGTTRTGWLTNAPKGWGGCVEARFNGRDLTDDPPDVEKYQPYTYANCPTAVVTPLTSTKATLIAGIDKLAAKGGTQIVGGAVWGWNMLSPRWQGLWLGTMGTTLPLNYGSTGMSKAAVIMTDGKNEIGTNAAYGVKTCPYDLFRRRYTCTYDERLGVSASSYDPVTASDNVDTLGDAALDAKMTAVCTAMKNAGITLYTVALGNPGTSIENRLKACASQPAFFFDSPTGADLQTAFAKIGDSLSSLRVSR